MITRLRVIAGGNASIKNPSRRTRIGRAERWEHYKCGECSDELGFPFNQLHDVKVGTFVTSSRGSAGEVIGGQQWLACPRCHQLRFQLAGDNHPLDEL